MTVNVISIVGVLFQGSEPREVWIPPSQRSQITVLKAADDSGYYTDLKTLLPLVLDKDSPIKSIFSLSIIGSQCY